MVEIDRKLDEKIITKKGDCGFFHFHSVVESLDFKREVEGKDGRKYKAHFFYMNWCEKLFEAQKAADIADWRDYVKQREKELEKIKTDSSTNQETKKELETKLNAQPFNPDQGTFNKLFNQIKEIQTDIKRSVPEKVKDAKEIMAQIETKNRELAEQMEQKLDKLRDDKNNLSAQLKKAMNDNNKAQVAIIKARMKETDDKIVEIIKDKNQIPNEEWVKKYMLESEKEKQKWFFQKIDWKRPKTYIFFGGALAGIVAIIFLIYWIIKKFIHGL